MRRKGIEARSVKEPKARRPSTIRAGVNSVRATLMRRKDELHKAASARSKNRSRPFTPARSRPPTGPRAYAPSPRDYTRVR